MATEAARNPQLVLAVAVALTSAFGLWLARFPATRAAQAAAPSVAPAPQQGPAAKFVPVVEGLEQPTAIAFAPGDAGRMFVAEKTGRLRVVRDGRLEPAPWIDLSGRVSDGSEQGLLGVAFHPRFAQNGRLFVNWTDERGDTRVTEYRARAEARPAAQGEVLYLDQPYANHNGGHLAFGPDGLLYVGTGDGGSRWDPQGNAQNDASRLGKMLVVDVERTPPAVRVVAKGLRNPWRYSFDRATGDLWIADVGQDQWEEVDVVPAGTLQGRNFGWPRLEGSHCARGERCERTGLVEPVAEYSHEAGCSITGGYVYRGRALPHLQGIYFYSDFCTGLLRGVRLRAGAAAERSDWKGRLDPEGRLRLVSTFGEDPEGELYAADFSGSVFKLVPAR